MRSVIIEGSVIVDRLYERKHFPHYVIRVIHTPEFQRLKNIHQLGVGSNVFSGATHTRFEHCIGTCYAATKMLDTLSRNVTVTSCEKMCVELAALLHDIGHGPFSHTWEGFVHHGMDKEWMHEESSVQMTRRLFANNNINLMPGDSDHCRAVDLICALITGDEAKLQQLLKPERMFLSEIVHNKLFKVDVDKWDYLRRDLLHLEDVISIDTSFLHFFEGARVIQRTADGRGHIAYRAADYPLIVELFETRAKLHIHCYQHPKILALERLLFDALLEAEKSDFRFKGCRLTEVHRSLEAYVHLTDNIINVLEATDDPKLRSAQNTLQLLKNRCYLWISSSDTLYDLEKLPEFPKLRFFQMKSQTPFASKMAPRDIPLYDESGRLIDSHSYTGSILDKLKHQGFYEQYHLYCTSTTPELNSYEALENYYKTLKAEQS